MISLSYDLRRKAALAVVGVFLSAGILRSGAAETLFDSNPDHIWNRLHNTLFIRVAPDGARYGEDSADILYWIRTKNLLEGESRSNAIQVLKEFTESHAATQVQDPWKRALLQSRCWSLFDWAARKSSFDEKTRDACSELQTRLATIIRQLALNEDQIAKLPNNLGASRELSALAKQNGDWISVKVPVGETTAQAHTRYFDGRPVFSVMFRHPQGRSAGTNYLAQLRAFSPMWIWRTNADSHRMDSTLNPEMPNVPANSQWALVRRMCVIDANGKIRATPVVETVQMRTFKKISTARTTFEATKDSQRMQQFDMRARDAALIEVSPDEKSFTHFFSKGFDPFEERRNNAAPEPSGFLRRTLASCDECHSNGSGIHSVNTFLGFFSHEPFLNTTQMEAVDNWENDVERTVSWKERQYSWGLLQGLAFRSRPE
jgi:hypothetical protein